MKKNIILCLSVMLLLTGAVFIKESKEKDGRQTLQISEVVTANGSLMDGDGDYPDWIEIYYNGEEPINLEGYYLSDDLQKPLRWRFPDVEMKPDSYLIVYASGKDKVSDSGELHTNFKLSYQNETVSLCTPEGIKITDVKLPELPFDHSYGKLDAQYAIFASGSPGEKNVQAKAAATRNTEKIEYSAVGGVYEKEVFLELQTEEKDAIIVYTLDGSIPTKESFWYDEKIHITDRTPEENRYTAIWSSPYDWDGQEGFSYNPNPQYKATVVKSRLYFPKEDVWSKEIWTNTYLIDSGYEIPVVSLSVNEADLFDRDSGICVPGLAYEAYLTNTENIDPEPRNRTGNYSYDRKVFAEMEYFSETGEKVLEQPVTLRICGNISRGSGMKSFIVNAWGDEKTAVFSYPFFEDDCTDANGAVVDTFSSIRLRNFGNDWRRSKFRDALGQGLVKDLNLGNQAYQPAILLINGEYYGLVEIRENRDAEYFEEHFGIQKEQLQEIKLLDLQRYGVVTEAEKEFMELVEFAETKDLSVAENYEYFRSQLDVEQFLDYVLVQLYIQNIDWYTNNCNFFRSISANQSGYNDGKWRVLLYDVDYSINYEYENNYETFYRSDYICARLLRGILKNESCKIYYIERFEELLKTNFDTEKAIRLQQRLEKQMEPYIAEDFARWNVYQEGVLVKGQDISYWYEKMEELRRFFKDRPAYAKEYFYTALDALQL